MSVTPEEVSRNGSESGAANRPRRRARRPATGGESRSAGTARRRAAGASTAPASTKPASRRRSPASGTTAPPPHIDGSPSVETGSRAAEALGAAEPVAVPTAGGLLGAAAAVVAQGRSVIREAARFGFETARIAAGRSALEPARGDRRFADPAWTGNPAYNRTMKLYLAWARAVNRLVDDLESSGTEWQKVEQARFAANILVSAVAPTNALWSNPAAIKHAFDTGGRSLVRGFAHWIEDLRHNGGMPAQVDRRPFVVGRDLAVTPGSVVARTEVAEVIQYRPVTPRVRERPVLIVPPPIGRFYFLDLRPGRSFVEFGVSRGFQMFMHSWRNPTPQQSDWDLDTYARGVLDSIDAVREVTGSDDVNVVGFCAGGIITTGVLNHLAETRDQRVNAMSYAVTLLDFAIPAPIGAFSSAGVLGVARRNSRRAGIISARQMGSVFTWMRPDDLVFNYWVNNYLMGNDPPTFDILAWNADGTNLPAALHEQFLDIFGRNDFCRPGGMKVLGSPIQLDRIRVPTFVTGAVTDHLTPWKGCYRTTQLLGGESTFILSNAGHIASLVNPPGNPKATYWSGGKAGADPDEWLQGATQKTGSWWEPWADWMAERSGAEKEAPSKLGSRRHPAREPAPGLYVRDALPA